jgi:hypothetical protein
MSSALVLKGKDGFYVFQSNDLNLDFTRQVNTGANSSSKMMKDLNKNSFIVITNNYICSVPEDPTLKKAKKDRKVKGRFIFGQIIR